MKELNMYDKGPAKTIYLVSFILATLLAIQIALGIPTGAHWGTKLYDFTITIGGNFFLFTLFIYLLAAILSLLFISVPGLVFIILIYLHLLNGVCLHYAMLRLQFSIILVLVCSVVKV